MTDPTPESIAATPAFAEFLPMTVERRDPTDYRLTMAVSAPHLNATGAVHGGILSTLLDIAAAGAAAVSVNDGVGTYGVTISLTVNFVAPAGAGRLSAHAVVLGGGARTKFVDAKVVDATNQLIATASASIRVIDI
ncbi:MAG: PaaI family thioesterase [Pseudomonadota bacterium]